MKVVKKVLIGFGIFIGVLLLAAVLIPVLFKSKIVELVKKEANKQLTATVDFDNNISLSLFRAFPNVSLGIDSLSIVNSGDFQGDTLVRAETVRATIDIMSLFRGDQMKIKYVGLKNAKIYAHINKDGKANYDITKPDTTTTTEDTASSFNMALSKYEITNTDIRYNDEQGGMDVLVSKLNHTGKGDFTADIYDLDTKTDIESLTFNYGGVSYLNKVKTTLKAIININMPESKYTLKDNELSLNDLKLLFNGNMVMPDSVINTDLTFKAIQSDFKNFLSLVPGIYSKSFADLTATGKFGIEGEVKGAYIGDNYPGMNIRMNISDGGFRYKGFSQAVTKVNTDISVQHPGGDLDRMKINIPNLSMILAGEPIQAHLILSHPMTDPLIDLAAKGKVLLDKFRDMIPLDKSVRIGGLVAFDVAVKGVLSKLSEGDITKIDARGFADAKNVVYEDKSVLPHAVEVSTGRLDFSPKTAELKNLNMKIGRSDFAMHGSFTNYLSYALSDGKLKGNLDLTSNLIDVSSLMPPTATNTPPAQAASANSPTAVPPANEEVLALPTNIDLKFSSKVNRILYETYDITNFSGNIYLANGKLTFESVKLNMLGSSMALAGSLDTKNPKRPEVNDLTFSIQDLAFQKMFEQIPVVQKYAPLLQRVQGKFNGNIKLTTPLAQGFMPILSQLTSNGALKINTATIDNFDLLKKVGDRLGLSIPKTIVVNNINPSYFITDGRINLKEPVKFAVDKANISIIGSSGLDQTLAYTMEIVLPADQIKGVVQDKVGNIFSASGLKMPIGQTVKVMADIGGTFTNPVIKLNIGQLGKDMLSGLKEQAEAELKAKAKELENEARAKIEAEKKKALDKANAEKEKLQQRAEEEKRKAQQRVEEERRKAEEAAKKAADEQKQKLKDELKKKGGDFFKR